ncbi:hypothetical protein ACQP00_23170 [Dactylosporangium sp. CS-047395]|uniref:hypothetical protein n=1 Tax=Dactylosporangium sp. CS-047395 TaxID=3239936 RepID=UPI003D8C7CE9
MSSKRTQTAILTLTTACTAAVLSPAPPAAAAPSLLPAGQARTIVLERSGGFAGEETAFVVDRTTVGGRPALRMAGSRAFLKLRRSYQPKNPCCDRYAYRVTVTYRGGHRKSVETVQGTNAPHVLWDVIGQSERYGVRPFTPRTATP